MPSDASDQDPAGQDPFRPESPAMPAVNLEPERFALRTPDGLILRAELLTPPDPIGIVVLCHPHPLHGGNMFASVIDSLFHHLGSEGFACVRFNFRGVTGSDGCHEYGYGEQADVRGAITRLHELFPGLPLSLVGWSFGADVSLAVIDPAIDHWLCIAPPLSVIEPAQMAAGTDRRAIHLVVPEHDQFCDPETAAGRTATWQNTTITTVPGADHFLNGKLGFLNQLAADTLPRLNQ